jgi:hypothetical protein
VNKGLFNISDRIIPATDAMPVITSLAIGGDHINLWLIIIGTEFEHNKTESRGCVEILLMERRQRWHAIPAPCSLSIIESQKTFFYRKL